MKEFINNDSLDNAPFNRREKDMDIDVYVTLTITQKVTLSVDDYDVSEEYDDDGELNIDVDTSSCDFKSHIYDQVEFPEGWEVVDVEYEEV